MAYIGEFDERRAWAVPGVLSCAHWLSWRLGMGQNAAGERVRVARALRELPATFAAFAEGRLSFTQVRAISRVATADDEVSYIGMARHATGGQLERLVSGVARARKLAKQRKAAATSEPEAERIRVFTRYDADGDLCITIKAGAADGAVLLAAVEAARNDLDTAGEPDEPGGPDLSAERSEGSDVPERSTRGDGLLSLCRAYLESRAVAHPGRARRDRSQLTVQIDPLSGWARLPDGEFLPPGSLVTALPAGLVLRPVGDADLTVHDQGRASRHPSQALRDLLGIVDGERCRFPSCTRRRKLHAHHVITWIKGGRTDLANMVLLCSRHHHAVVHAAGFHLSLNPVTRALTVTTAEGEPVPHRHQWPWQPAEHLDPDATIHAATLPPDGVDKLDLHYAVGVLMQHAA